MPDVHALQFPDYELWMTGYLRVAMPGMFVSRAIPTDPAKRPAEMVICNSDGGPAMSVRHEVQRFRVRTFAATPLRAMEMARLAQKALTAVVSSSIVTRVDKDGGPFHVTDAAGPLVLTTYTVRAKAATA